MQVGVRTVAGRRNGGSWPRSTLPNGVWRQGPAAANRGAHSCHQVTERTRVGTPQTNVNWRLLRGRCGASAKQKADRRSVLLKHSHKKDEDEQRAKIWRGEADESAAGLWARTVRPGGGWSGRQVQQHLLPPPLGV